jgi:cell wall-associated NlpC family hydrolase
VVTARRNLKVLRLTMTVSTGVALAVCGASLADAATGAAKTTVNIRSGPSTSNAIKGSLVRGQRITVIRKAQGGWVRVSFAGSRAYISSKYIDTTGALPTPPKKIKTSGTKIATEDLNVRTGAGTSYRIVGTVPEGSRLRLTGKQRAGFAETRYAGHVRWVSVTYLARAGSGGGAVYQPPSSSAAKGRAALAYARRQLGKPYQWGAEGPNRFDCSGLVLAAWRTVGVSMPRTARQQYAQGHKISRSQLRAGDLVFFYTQRPHHVGMYVGNGRIIDAPRPGKTVRYTTISHMPYSGAVRPG